MYLLNWCLLGLYCMNHVDTGRRKLGTCIYPYSKALSLTKIYQTQVRWHTPFLAVSNTPVFWGTTHNGMNDLSLRLQLAHLIFFYLTNSLFKASWSKSRHQKQKTWKIVGLRPRLFLFWITWLIEIINIEISSTVKNPLLWNYPLGIWNHQKFDPGTVSHVRLGCL